MSNFKKIFGLAGTVMVFTGVAFGQVPQGQTTCTAPMSTTTIIRAEGTTEQVAPVTFTCTNNTAQTQPAGAAVNVQVFLSPAVPVTDRVIVSGTGQTEAVLTIANSAGSQTQILGTVNGSTINFSGVTPVALPAAGANPAIPNTVLPSGSLTFTIQNVRVNASSLTVGTGVPPSISETVFISGPAVLPAALAAVNVAFAQNGLAPSRVTSTFTSAAGSTNVNFPANVTIPTGTATGTNNFVICGNFSPKIDNFLGAGAAFNGRSLIGVVEVNENFAQAFKTAGDEADQVTFASNTGVGGPTTSNNVTTTSNTNVNSTRIRLSFANVPSGATVVVPTGTITSQQGGAQITLVNSETGTTIQGTDSLAGENGANLRAVSISSGAGTAVYSVITSDFTNLDKFEIPVFLITASNSIAGTATPMTVSVSFAPVGSSNVPNFASTSSTSQLTLSTFSLCTTSLLFPFVTNQLGFDTGLAIANTSSDPFGARGAAAQAGTCSLNFYGAGAPSPANVTTPNIPTGTVYTQVLSNVGAGFQGYMIAQCNFQFAHGFAFVTDGVGANGGLSQGYLAGVIPDTNQKVRAADPLSAAIPGTGETLGN